MPELTVQLHPDEAGIALMQFPQNFFRKLFSAVPQLVYPAVGTVPR